ncbi:MAG: FHA domain-containing protein [Pseudomonadota bacterium]
MAKLILTLGGNKIKEFELNKEQMIIGRRASSDIQVENLAVSGEHAKILTILNDSFLEDLKSTNGTFVNGALVKKQALQNGDVITIGKHKLHYVNEAAGSEGFDQTVFIRPSGGSPGPAPAPSADNTNSGSTDLDNDATMDNASLNGQANLTITNGAKAGQILGISKSVTTLGRPGVQVAAITQKDDRYYLLHIETANNDPAPTLNGVEVGDAHALLNNNDEIVVAGIKMVFHVG